MKDILWVKLPIGTSQSQHEEITKVVNNLNLDEIQVIVTTGDVELHFFNRRIFVYPYWLLKLKMLFK